MYAGDKFGGEISVMAPPLLSPGTEEYATWFECMQDIEDAYKALAEKGMKPDVCRMVLPHSTKADINLTANLREWRHILRLRTSPRAHPTIYTLLIPLLLEFKRRIPVIFDDIEAPKDEELSDWAKKRIAKTMKSQAGKNT
jgi:thymidylate synthase (FAD)